MKWDQVTERRLMEMVESAGSGWVGILPDGADAPLFELVRDDKVERRNRIEFVSSSDVAVYMKLLCSEGYLDGDFSSGWRYSHLTLTLKGHERLRDLRSNRWWLVIGRAVGRWADKAMSSIVFPIMVAVLTVVVMDYFELSVRGTTP